MFRHKLLNLLTYFQAVLLACLLTFAAAAQQADQSGVETPEPATTDNANLDDVNPDVTDDAGETPDETADGVEDIEDSDLDQQTYEQDDDDFTPTEEIPADEPIPFPSNI